MTAAVVNMSAAAAAAAPAAAAAGFTVSESAPAPALEQYQLSLLRPKRGAEGPAAPPAAPSHLSVWPGRRRRSSAAAAIPAALPPAPVPSGGHAEALAARITPGGKAATFAAAHEARRHPSSALVWTADPQASRQPPGRVLPDIDAQQLPAEQLIAAHHTDAPEPRAALSALLPPHQPLTQPTSGAAAASSAAPQAWMRPGGKAAAFAAAAAQRNKAARVPHGRFETRSCAEVRTARSASWSSEGGHTASSASWSGGRADAATSVSWSGGETDSGPDGGRISEGGSVSSHGCAPPQHPQKRQRRRQQHQEVGTSMGRNGCGGKHGSQSKWPPVYKCPDGSIQWAPTCKGRVRLRLPASVRQHFKVSPPLQAEINEGC